MAFTSEQLAAIDQSVNVGSCYIDATAGAGKSTTLAEIARQITSKNDGKLWLITFTNAAAKEIMHKANINNVNTDGGTFHSMSLKLIKATGIQPNICDEYKKTMIIKTIFNCKKDKEKFQEIYKAINDNKCNYPLKPCEYTEKYNEELYRLDLFDFDDLIFYGIETIKTCNINLLPTYILVDELQDTNSAQLAWLEELNKRTNARMIGVADADQSLYTFRGARLENVFDFIREFKCTIKPLGLNFRSTTKIVDSARRLIENNKQRTKKDIRANSKLPGTLQVFSCTDNHMEIERVVALCKKHRNDEIFILYRNRMLKIQLEYELRKNNVLYNVNDSTELTDRSAFRTVISMCKIGAKCYDVHDLEDAMKAMKKFGKSALEKIKALDINKHKIHANLMTAMDNDKKLARTLSTVIDIQKTFEEMSGQCLSKFVEKLYSFMIPSFVINDQMKELLTLITSTYKVMQNDIFSLCNELGLNGKEENNDDNSNVTLGTIHSSKGLQRKVVIIPFCDWKMNPEELEADRRLMYVAVTRAETTCYLTYSEIKPRFIRELGL